jgi:hypothetical protein
MLRVIEPFPSLAVAPQDLNCLVLSAVPSPRQRASPDVVAQRHQQIVPLAVCGRNSNAADSRLRAATR